MGGGSLCTCGWRPSRTTLRPAGLRLPGRLCGLRLRPLLLVRHDGFESRGLLLGSGGLVGARIRGRLPGCHLPLLLRRRLLRALLLRRRRGCPVADHPDPPLQPIHPGMETAFIGVSTGQQHPGTHQLQVQAGRGGAAHGRQTVGDHLGGAGQLPRTHARDLRGETLRLVRGNLQHAVLGGLRHRGEDHQVPQPPQQVLGEPAGILADLDDLVDAAEHPRRVPRGEGVDDLVQQRVRGESEQRRRLVVGDALRTGAAEQLVQHRQGIAHRSATRAHHQRQG